MAELAPGPASGYIYQFELALAMLSGLDHLDDVLSIEKVDDVAIEDEKDLVTMTVQSKHSISPNGTTFEDTSKALWRTIEIWIQKLLKQQLGVGTIFVCATNKAIPATALIRKIQNEALEELQKVFGSLLVEQKQKLEEAKKRDKNKGTTISKTIAWIEYALSNWEVFAIIKTNIQIWDNSTPRDKFLNKIHMAGPDYPDVVKDNVYHSMLGWITYSAKAKWMQGEEANFTKTEFDQKYLLIRDTPSLVRAVFRKKVDLRTISVGEIEDKRSELFVRQIEDIKRRTDAKTRKIEEAIINFLYYDIEVSHILRKGNVTKADFDEFREKCRSKWESCFDNHVKKEIEEYSDDDKHELAITIYDEIMDKIEVKFMEDFSFNTDNRYIHNGTFLKLSNIPEIGWHPDWKMKYKKGS